MQLCFGAFSQVAKYSNDFLDIGVGARWLSMGSTGVAGGSDVEAAYWNPAGLNRLQRSYEVGALHASYFAGMAAYNHMALAHRLDTASAVAFTAIRFGVDDIPNTTDMIDAHGNISYDRITMFSVADYAFLLSYARKLVAPGLSVGGNAKIIYRNVGKFANAWGFGFDLGAQYQLGNWYFGANARDITSTFNIWSFNANELEITIGDSTFNQVPSNSFELTLPSLALGVSRGFSFSDDVYLATELNAVMYFDGQRNTPISTSFASIEPRLGAELGYKRLLFIRLGVNNMQRVREFDNRTALTLQPNIGIGIEFRGVALDYALTNVASTGFTRYSNIFSLRWGFGKAGG